MRLLIVTDAWDPQVNGVVRTLKRTVGLLRDRGIIIEMVTPLGGRTMSCPTYSEIQLSLNPFGKVSRAIESFQPDCIHICTEGPLGWSARKYCQLRGIRFSTSFHTRFAEYLYERTGFPVDWSYGVLRRFHSLSKSVMVTTPSMERRLKGFGFQNLRRWGRGVDVSSFRPLSRKACCLPRLLYVGRVAVEKNLEAFLKMNVDGEKTVVGDGPQKSHLERKYQGVHFTGAKFGEELVELYASADVFVFPSKTDTFGLVMLEALACGTPVAAFPTEGPIDVIQSSEVGVLDHDLKRATQKALTLNRKKCREYALKFSWENAARQFYSNLVSA